MRFTGGVMVATLIVVVAFPFVTITSPVASAQGNSYVDALDCRIDYLYDGPGFDSENVLFCQAQLGGSSESARFQVKYTPNADDGTVHISEHAVSEGMQDAFLHFRIRLESVTNGQTLGDLDTFQVRLRIGLAPDDTLQAWSDWVSVTFRAGTELPEVIDLTAIENLTETTHALLERQLVWLQLLCVFFLAHLGIMILRDART